MRLNLGVERLNERERLYRDDKIQEDGRLNLKMEIK